MALVAREEVAYHAAMASRMKIATTLFPTPQAPKSPQDANRVVGCWDELSEELKQEAKRLSKFAKEGNLVYFMGAGELNCDVLV